MNDKFANNLRSFGMTGYLITDELRSIEEKYKIDLGHSKSTQTESASDYYAQFEQEIRTEAILMSNHYELFYCLEQSIRKLVVETLVENEGANWWDSGRIPQKIRDDVKDRTKREIDSGVTRRSDREIDYTTFGELSVIITSNWDLFGALFSSRRAVEKVMSSLNLLRGPIAHCCSISEDEIVRLRLTVKDWFRMMS